MTTVAPPRNRSRNDGEQPRSGPRRQRTAPPQTIRVLNIPLLIGTVVAIAVLAPAAYFWHQYQFTQGAGAYLDRATDLEQEEDWSKASAYLHRYLQVHPEADDVRIRLAETFDKGARDYKGKMRAIELYYRALGIDSTRLDIRKRVTELLLETRRFTEAIEQSNKLREQDPGDPLALRTIALSNYGLYRKGARDAKRIEEVIELFKRALAVQPGNVDLAVTLGYIYRKDLRFPEESERAKMADDVVNHMVDARLDEAEVYLARHRYRQLHDLTDSLTGLEKAQDVETAVSLAPDDYDILVAAGEAQLEVGIDLLKEKDVDAAHRQLRRSQDHFQKAIEIDEKDARAHLGLGQAYLAQEKSGLAIDTWRNGLEKTETKGNRFSIGPLELTARLFTTYTRLNRLDDAKDLLRELEDGVNKVNARARSDAERTQVKQAIDRLKGRYYFAKGDYRLASHHLRSAVSAQTGLQANEHEQNQRFEASMLLASCFERLGEWDQAAATYQSAIKIKPQNSRAKLLAGRAHTKAGNPAAADRVLSEVDQEDELAVAAWLPTVEARLRKQLSLAEEERDWAELTKLMSSPPPAVAGTWQYKLLQTDLVMAVKGDAGKAEGVEFLRQAERMHPNSTQLLEKLVTIYERFGQSDDADRALAKLETQAQGTIVPNLVRARLLSSRGDDAQAKKLLDAALAKATEAELPAIRYSMAQIALRSADIDSARENFEELAKINPDNTATIRQLLELVLQQRDYKAAQAWEDKLKETEGDRGTLWRYYRARRLLAQAKSPRDPGFIEAMRLESELENLRANWAPRFSLKGQLAAAEGETEEAIDAFRKAIELGENRVMVYEQLVTLLFRSNQLEEAQQYLSKLREYTSSSQYLSGIELNIAARQGEKKRAVDLARKSAEARPDDVLAQIRWGNALLFDSNVDEAGKVFRATAAKFPNDIAAWNGLFSFFVRSGQRAEALKALENLPDSDNLEPAQRAFILAQGYQLLGDQQQAAEQFDKARKLAPENPTILMKSAEILASRDLPQAESILRDVRKLEPKNDRARQMLAKVLIAQGGEDHWKEAQTLLRNTGQLSQADQRLLAQSLLQRGGMSNRRQAQQVLERLVGDPATSQANDHILLARIHEMDGRLQSARDQYLTLVGRDDSRVQALALLVDMFLRHDDAEAATSWLKRLSSEERGSMRTLQLQVRWLKQLDREGEIARLVNGTVREQLKGMEDDAQRARLFQQVGDLYSSIDMHTAAEPFYRQIVKLNANAYGPLVRCLMQQHKVGDAVALCQAQAVKEDNGRPAIILASAASSVQQQIPDQLKQVEPVIAEAMQKYPENLNLAFAVAYLRTVQQRYDDAVSIYERLLRERPTYVPTLNNLAAVLTEIPSRRDEALQYIDKAIDLAGPQPALLDTKAMALIESNPRQAAALLRDATTISNPDPRYLFHLALAYQRTGEKNRARDALAEAEAKDLESMDLTQSDERQLRELRETLK